MIHVTIPIFLITQFILGQVLLAMFLWVFIGKLTKCLI